MTIAILSLIFLICVSTGADGQNNTIVDLSQLPEDGLVLNKGWRYKVGDNADWAMADFDDRDWKSVNPSQDIHELPMLWKDSIVWFRIHLRVDSLQVGDLAMNVTHAGASEIYLDGRWVHRFGVVSRDPDEIFAIDPNEEPVSFPVNRSGVHVLAVRYVLEPNVYYTTMWRRNGNFGLNIRINSIENASEYFERTFGFFDIHGAFRISAYLILAILYLTFYVSYRRRKTSLYFFIYAFLWAAHWSMTRYLDHLSDVRYSFYVAIVILIFQIGAWFICLVAIYELLYQSRRWTFYALCALGVVSLPISLFVYPGGWYFFARGFTTLAILDIVRVSLAAFLRRKSGAGIIVIGAFSWLILWSVFVLASMGLINTSPYVNHWFIFALSHLVLPVAVVIYLGYDFALTNRSLQQKLVEVEMLSAEKNRILSSQNEMLEGQVSQRTAELTKSLDHLKATQAQLIHSEKMASLGELVAGIAHEIQNPLNFVNNFSEVNTELIDDLKDELASGNNKSAVEIADTIKENQQKINHHGKRADGIVKNMLQHSRSGSGQKELTDLNSLCNEYVRLAFHGFRAKDKSFNAAFETNLDATLPKVNIVPHDIGRVILNIINNAFYAVNEKSAFAKASSDEGYEPRVIVTSKVTNGRVEVRIKDNGNGISGLIKEKIFQPFFTTKPTGQGTGLGLSLAYDIITKAHGGELRVETIEGDGAEFIVSLPTQP